MITSRRDFLAANPWIECMIAPFYFRIFTHHKSPKFRASLCPKHRSRSYPLQVSFPPLAVAKRTNIIGPTTSPRKAFRGRMACAVFLSLGATSMNFSVDDSCDSRMRAGITLRQALLEVAAQKGIFTS
jgi:hypothetical protein